MWFGIVKQYEIGKHLNRPIGDIPIQKRRRESTIAEAKDEVSVGCKLRLNTADSRDSLLHTLQDSIKYRTVVFIKILSDARKILARLRQVLHDTGGLFPSSRGTDVEVRDMPILKELPQGVGCLEALELSESLNSEDIWRLQLLLFALK